MKTQLKKAQEIAETFKSDNRQYYKQETANRKFDLTFKWTISRGKDTYGYNVCSLYVEGEKVASCNGGGYDMQGTVLGNWIANKFSHRLYKLIDREFSGLSFHNPFFNVNDEVFEKSDGTFTTKEDEGKTFGELEKAGKVVDLLKYQAFHKASSDKPTENHIYAIIDGACGIDSVKRIGEAIGLTFEWLPQSERFKNYTFYTIRDFMNSDKIQNHTT